MVAPPTFSPTLASTLASSHSHSERALHSRLGTSAHAQPDSAPFASPSPSGPTPRTASDALSPRALPKDDSLAQEGRAFAQAIRVILIDDHALVRESLAQRLLAEDDLDVVATAADADTGLAHIHEYQPDVVLMDIDMPGQDCFEAASRLRREYPTVHLVFLSAHTNDRYIESAIAVGAKGYLSKSQPPREVAESIRLIVAGKTVFCPEVRSRLVDNDKGQLVPAASATRLSSLSPREQEVLRHLAQGLSKRQVARVMHISVKTVGAHTTSLMAKLDIHDRVDLARYAIREGITEA